MFKKLVIFLLVVLGAVIVYAGQAEVDESLKAISNLAVRFRYYVLPDNSLNIARFTGTLPSIPTANVDGIVINITSSGSASLEQRGVNLQLLAGYTGADTSYGIRVSNLAQGTATAFYGNNASLLGNIGIYSISTGVTAGSNLGSYNLAANSTGYNIGSFSRAAGGTDEVGVFAEGVGNSTRNVALFATFANSTIATLENATLLVDNNAQPSFPLLVTRQAGTRVFTIDVGGNIKLLRTITPAGTTGAQTINQPSGTVNFAAAATTLVVTNSLVDASSIIHAMARTNDGTCHVKDIEMAVGSFTIRMTAACTAETSVGFLVTN